MYAHWIGVENKVVFDADGGTVDTKEIKVIFGKDYGTLPTPTKEGYTFGGWYTAKAGGEKIVSDTAAQILETQVLYARWKIVTYKVTMDGNGGSMTVYIDGQPQVVKTRTKTVVYAGTYGGEDGKFPAFTRSGYTLVGFFTEAEGGVKVTPGTEFTAREDQRLYAHWEPLKITVAFDTESTETIRETKTVTYGETYGTLPVPKREGHTFLGWTATETSSTQVTAETLVKKTSGHTLYAKWSANEYTVTFDANGGTAEQTSKTVVYGKTYGSLPDARREGYTFDGWYTAVQGGKMVAAGDTHDYAASVTLYAHWTKGGYSIAFSSNGGTAVPSITVYSGSYYGELPATEKAGYDFTGWYTQKTGGNQVEGTDRTADENITLYAHWKAKTPTILFYANGGNLEETEAAKTAVYGEDYGKLPTPKLSHYTFDGWHTQADGGAKVTAGSTVETEETQTLYAHWTPDTVTITLDAAGGQIADKTIFRYYEQEYGDIKTPVKDGFIFSGWYTEPDAGLLITQSMLVKNPESHTLYARWTKEKANVIFDANGGTAQETERNVPYGSVYGKLPEAQREGYILTGWYTKPDGGSKISETDIMSEKAGITLYAHWEAEQYTITLDSMGGNCEIPSVCVTFGEAYGKLPTPEYPGFSFVGWYLEQEGQTKVEEDTLVTAAGDHTLYAYYVRREESAKSRMAAMHFGQDGINPASGNVSFSVTDIVMDIPGLSHDMARTYNSQNTEPTAMGRGWTFGFEGHCEVYSDGVIVYLPDGSAHVFLLKDGQYIGEGSRSKLTRNQDNTFVLTKPDQIKYWFDKDNTLSCIEDRNGNRTETAYTNGKISSFTDPTGRVYQIETNQNGQITKITDPMGGSVNYAYDEAGLLIHATNLLGGVTTYEYDTRGYLARITDPNGNVIQDFSYTDKEKEDEAAGYEVTKCVDSYGGIKTYTYCPEENKTEITDESGRLWTYWYNSDMYITDVQNPDGSMSRTEYYENAENCHYADVKSETDEYGNVTQYSRDESGNTTKITYCDGSQVSYWYDIWNNCIAEKDENGNYTYHYYDDRGANLLKNIRRVDGAAIDPKINLADLSFQDADYIVEQYEYYTRKEAEEQFDCGLSGLLKCAVDAEGRQTRYTYDQYGNTASVTDAAGNVTQYTYDALGRKLSETTPSGNKFAWKYAANGFVTREYYPDGGCAVSEYDKAGHLVRTVSQELYRKEQDLGNHYAGGEGSYYVYNASGRLESMTDALKNRTEYTYDSNGNTLTQTMPDKSVLSYEYDNRDRVIRQWLKADENTPAVLLKEVSYTTLNNGETQTAATYYRDEENKIVNIEIYDNRGRIKETYIPSGEEKLSLCTYEYYPDGKQKTVTENGHKISYTYDTLGNITAQEEPFLEQNGVVSHTRTINTYNRVGELLTSQVYTVGMGEQDENVSAVSCRYENRHYK